MWLYCRGRKLKPKAIVDDEWVRDYITDDELILAWDGEDLRVMLVVAVFQPIGEYQIFLF